MKRTILTLAMTLPFLLLLGSCELVDVDPKNEQESEGDSTKTVGLDEVAALLSSVPLGTQQVREVYDAVLESAGNGYDEEYTMAKLFTEPGAGVGSELVKSSGSGQVKGSGAATKSYSRPLKDLLQEYLAANGTKTASEMTAEEYLEYLKRSDIQIYWPYLQENGWDGSTYPVITFDPLSEASTNEGYLLKEDANGKRYVEKITVTEEMAMQRPVWVVNNNSDAGNTSLEVMRRNNPDWAGGGVISIKSASTGSLDKTHQATSSTGGKALILKDFTMNRHYDSWFRGASEFFVKVGAVESFTAKVESDLYLYSPSITDFMVVVRRSQKGKAVEMNTLLVSDWTSQLDNIAFMIIEDDGGTITSWTCSAVVKYNSKSYGFEMTLPYKSRDDIVWRGQLSRRYIEAGSEVTGNFGDVKLSFEIESY